MLSCGDSDCGRKERTASSAYDATASAVCLAGDADIRRTIVAARAARQTAARSLSALLPHERERRLLDVAVGPGQVDAVQVGAHRARERRVVLLAAGEAELERDRARRRDHRVERVAAAAV